MSVLHADGLAGTRRPKRERVEVRISQDEKALLQQAALLEGRTLSDFLVSSAHRAATEAIREHQVISLSVSESRRFADALLILNPPEPSDYMLEAFRRYRRLVSQA